MEQTIVRATFPLSKELTPAEAEVIVSQQSKRIKFCNDAEIYNALKDSISKCYFNCGQAMNVINVDLEINELIIDLKKYFPTIAINEISSFFKQGIDGLYGEYFGLNCKSYRKFIRDGSMHANRLLAMKKQNLFLAELNKPKELTAEEKADIIFKGVLDSFEEFKKTKFVYDTGNVTYNWLNERNHIPFTNERKLEMLKDAEAKIKAGMVDSMQSALSAIERNKIKADMDGLSSKDTRIKAEAKRIALNTFFRELVEVGTELTEIINP